MNWTKEEVLIVINDYFEMFKLEQAGIGYNKSAHRKNLIKLLPNRTKAIEFKHQNVSGVLAKMGYPYIKGYKPLFGYQQLLADEVMLYLKSNKLFFEKEFQKFVAEEPELEISNIDFKKLLEKSPASKTKSKKKEIVPSFIPIKINYLAKEQNNRILGERGEELVLDYEKWRLAEAGKYSLADKVEWVSKSKGDGLGYDILSKNNNGTDRFIEVKTTKLAKETPIYLSQNELIFSSIKGDDFYLYRVFNFKDDPKIFIKQGTYASFCQLKPQSYKGFF